MVKRVTQVLKVDHIVCLELLISYINSLSLEFEFVKFNHILISKNQLVHYIFLKRFYSRFFVFFFSFISFYVYIDQKV
ncbi:hypothetical protein ES332_D09G201500v1 [Gossypium tomentosum]|uniref:Uncharacterized protein n=1 Tax=Gossypium tomentosum TaxID=34277 RepID=A0A5D2JKM2_GOSTO|nr:hypothetical protein ES332_D09G201500v1 [Gossypium tomentosum]